MSIIQLLLVPLLLAVTSQDPQKSPAMDLEDLVRKVGPSVGALRVFDRDGDLSAEGTAFVASPFASDPKKRFLVTNRHVVLGASAVQVIFPSQEPFTVGPVVAYDVIQDLVVFSLEGLPEGIVALELSPVLPNVGQRLAVIGNAKGLANSVSDGVTSSTREFKDRGTMIQMSVPIYHGSSGSPVFTSNGKVVGIATSGLDDAQSINFAVPTSKLLALHCGAGIAIEIWSGASQSVPAGTRERPTKIPFPQQDSPPLRVGDSSPLSWAEVLEQNPDPKVVTDADFLKRITETKLPWRVKDKSSDIEMLLVPPGKFVMGMSPGDSLADVDEKPAHEVTITKAFYLGRTEVTQEQWMKVMGEKPSFFQDGSRENLIAKYIDEGLTKQEAQERAVKETPNDGWAQEKNPVEIVSWDDCQKFCRKTGMKLPTEAQWEYACRAGVRKPRYGELGQIAWCDKNSQRATHPVNQKAPNALGFYDMIGNVWEWTNDWYKGDYYKSCADGGVDPTGPAQSERGARVLRGGGWCNSAGDDGYRASHRDKNAPGYQYIDIGCRFARTAD